MPQLQPGGPDQVRGHRDQVARLAQLLLLASPQPKALAGREPLVLPELQGRGRKAKVQQGSCRPRRPECRRLREEVNGRWLRSTANGHCFISVLFSIGLSHFVFVFSRVLFSIFFWVSAHGSLCRQTKCTGVMA